MYEDNQNDKTEQNEEDIFDLTIHEFISFYSAI